MGTFFGAIFGLYLIGAFLSWPFFWAKKTRRSQAPIVRRGIGLAYALTWPYMIVKYFTGQQQKRAATAGRHTVERRIVGGEPSASGGPGLVQSQPRMQNPLDSD
jgi:hypothetical protein